MTYKEWQQSFVVGDKTGLQEAKSDDTISSMDITNEWTKAKGIKGTVTKRQEYTVNGTTYKVDGKHVLLKPSDHERDIAAVLSEMYGKPLNLFHR